MGFVLFPSVYANTLAVRAKMTSNKAFSSFQAWLIAKYFGDLRHEMKYGFVFFLSFSGGRSTHNLRRRGPGMGWELGNYSENLENDGDYQAISENGFSNNIPL